MSTSKEYKAVRNCILNELHLTKEDIIKNIEPLLEKLVKRCMHNTYGGNNQIENWIRCMVNDELKQFEIWTISTTRDNRQRCLLRLCCYIYTSRGKLYTIIRRGAVVCY
jgi:hypothetical protein